jgi:hypothetical protein
MKTLPADAIYATPGDAGKLRAVMFALLFVICVVKMIPAYASVVAVSVRGVKIVAVFKSRMVITLRKGLEFQTRDFYP